MNRKLLLVVLSLLTILAMTACTAAPQATAAPTAEPVAASAEPTAEATAQPSAEPAATEVTITHGLGETVVPVNPQRILVFDFGTLDALDFAGVEVIGIASSGNLASHLEKFGSEPYVNVGTLFEPDFEKVNELEPDLILIGGRTTTAYEELSKIAPTVLMTMPTTGYLDTFEDNMNILAQIFPDKADVFTGEVAAIRETAAKVSADVQAKGYNALVIMANDGEISVFGKGSRFAVVYDDFGFAVSDESIEQSTHGQSATFEYVAEQNPDFLFVIDRSAATGAAGASGAAQLLDNELINGIDAAKSDRIIYLDSTNWYVVSGGITSTRTMAQELLDASAK